MSSDSRWSDHVHMVKAVGSTTTGYYPTAAGVATEGATSVLVHITSASTSSATVSIEGSVDGSFWKALYTATDPTVNGVMAAGPAPKFIRANISAHASGTLSVAMVFRTMQADPIGSEWKLLTAAANTFGALSVTALTDTGLTITRVPYADTGGLLKDAAGLAYVESTGTLSATVLKGGLQQTAAAKLTDGPIAVSGGSLFITKGSALGSSTLATPVATDDDGKILRIVSTTAYAHVITVTTGKVNKLAATTITFTSAAVGDQITLQAMSGIWYVIGTIGTITIA